MRRIVCLLVSLVIIGYSQINRIPDFRLKLIDGKRITINDLLKDGPILIDFWALWCAPCLKEMRYLDEFHRTYREQGLTVLAINLDTERSVSKVRAYIKSNGYNLTVAVDPSLESYRRMNGNTMPYTLLVDKTGNIVYKHTGYVPGDEVELQEKIIELFNLQKEVPTGS